MDNYKEIIEVLSQKELVSINGGNGISEWSESLIRRWARFRADIQMTIDSMDDWFVAGTLGYDPRNGGMNQNK